MKQRRGSTLALHYHKGRLTGWKDIHCGGGKIGAELSLLQKTRGNKDRDHGTSDHWKLVSFMSCGC